jgi:hypothetical protein
MLFLAIGTQFASQTLKIIHHIEFLAIRTHFASQKFKIIRRIEFLSTTKQFQAKFTSKTCDKIRKNSTKMTPIKFHSEMFR